MKIAKCIVKFHFLIIYVLGQFSIDIREEVLFAIV